MGGQFHDLLLDVSRKLGRVEESQARLLANQRELAEGLGELRTKIAAIEADARWYEKERNKLDGRLESGDHTFTKLQSEIGEVRRMAEQCRDLLQNRSSTKKRTWKELGWELLKVSMPMIGSIVWMLLYHLLMVGPQIAEAMKKAGVGH